MCVDHKGKTKEFYKVFVLTRQQQQKITKTVTIYALGKTRQNWGTWKLNVRRLSKADKSWVAISTISSN